MDIFNNMSVIYIAVGTYLLNTFKGAFFKIWKQIVKRYSSTIVADTSKHGGERIYTRAMNWVIGLNKRHISNNTIFEYDMDAKDNANIRCITGPGQYFVYLKYFTWAKINITKEKLDHREIERIYISIIGLRHTHISNKIRSLVCQPIKRDPLVQNASARHNIYYSMKYKSFDRIFINEKERIINSIDKWVDNKDFYKENQLTYKLGILLHGEPGTGKSSFVLALANYLNYNIRIATIGSLLEGKTGILPNSIILIEEIDTVLGNKTMEVDGKTISSSIYIGELLQLLDGIESPNNVIFVMTTNHREQLDDRLFRPGRIDLDIHLGKINEDTAMQMLKQFNVTDEKFISSLTFPINPSKLQQKILDNLNILDSLEPREDNMELVDINSKREAM